MPAALSNYLENALMNAVLRNSAYSSPATVYASLHTANPAEDASGAEVSGGSYARQSMAFGAPSDGVCTNSGTVTFPTATLDWGTVSHFALWDNVSGGNMLFYGALTQSKLVSNGDTFKFNIGQVTVSLD